MDVCFSESIAYDLLYYRCCLPLSQNKVTDQYQHQDTFNWIGCLVSNHLYLLFFPLQYPADGYNEGLTFA